MFGSVSSLGALPLVAAACDNTKKEEKKDEKKQNENASTTTTSPATTERPQADAPQTLGSSSEKAEPRVEYSIGLASGELEDLVNAISTDRDNFNYSVELAKKAVAPTSEEVLKNSEAARNKANFENVTEEVRKHLESTQDSILANSEYANSQSSDSEEER
ncbi:hypothetical protein BCF89_102112 [Metamycoplasma auris]|uniref:Lipoprotein n=1 Tax=Metamycoplasma auris TaxID=51363 RepID=A0A2W7G8W2_9BACT|nr:hypothetical protein BCF89_102112 [Metamycoplasma auris]